VLHSFWEIKHGMLENPPHVLRWLKKDCDARTTMRSNYIVSPKTLDENKFLSLHFFHSLRGFLGEIFNYIPEHSSYSWKTTTFGEYMVSTSWSLNQPTCQPLQWLSTTGFKIVTVLQLSTTGCYNASYHIHSIPDKKNSHHDHPMYFYTEGRKVKTQFHGCDLVMCI